MESQAMVQMPRYKCHKEVWALKIEKVILSIPVTIVPEDKRYAPIAVETSWYAKHSPVAGGYYVVYDDGYSSFSPAKAFEGGYKLIS